MGEDIETSHGFVFTSTTHRVLTSITNDQEMIFRAFSSVFSFSTYSWDFLTGSLVPQDPALEALQVVDNENRDVGHLEVHQLVLQGKHKKELNEFKGLTNNLPAGEHKELQQSILNVRLNLKLIKVQLQALVSSSLE